MIVRLARQQDFPGFHSAVSKNIRQSRALVAVSSGSELVVSEKERGKGAGRALMTEAMDRFVQGPGSIEVVTFGADHPGAVASGARVFYERLGFDPAEAADPGPEGGSRQVYRRAVT
ncbi:GNAT family N-acetyltransferase [Streptomyces sp. NBC_00019]|uniref:GNAT family N-acetyltransferase n=1 Tax=Streptomyces sp. NBC_00019 TaxID=2975623 RepID=UPI00386EBCF8